jgi:hypothetical protein
MATRETKAARASRVSMLLADFDARSKELNKLQAIVKGLKAQVAEIEVGTYGEWIRTEGTPRNMLDQPAVLADYAARGVEPPMKLTKAPVQVTPVAGR